MLLLPAPQIRLPLYGWWWWLGKSCCKQMFVFMWKAHAGALPTESPATACCIALLISLRGSWGLGVLHVLLDTIANTTGVTLVENWIYWRLLNLQCFRLYWFLKQMFNVLFMLKSYFFQHFWLCIPQKSIQYQTTKLGKRAFPHMHRCSLCRICSG